MSDRLNRFCYSLRATASDSYMVVNLKNVGCISVKNDCSLSLQTAELLLAYCNYVTCSSYLSVCFLEEVASGFHPEGSAGHPPVDIVAV